MIYYVFPYNSKVYKVDTLGIVSTMSMNVGLMEMLRFNINPYYKDLPQLTIDYTIALNIRKLSVEVYDFMINKDAQDYKDFLTKIEEINAQYSDLADITSEEAWNTKYIAGAIRKSGTLTQDERLLNITSDVISCYIEYAKKVQELSNQEVKTKYELTKDFADQLVVNGGNPIDTFKKELGKEKTEEFVGKVLYGYLHIELVET